MEIVYLKKSNFQGKNDSKNRLKLPKLGHFSTFKWPRNFSARFGNSALLKISVAVLVFSHKLSENSVLWRTNNYFCFFLSKFHQKYLQSLGTFQKLLNLQIQFNFFASFSKIVVICSFQEIRGANPIEYNNNILNIDKKCIF